MVFKVSLKACAATTKQSSTTKVFILMQFEAVNRSTEPLNIYSIVYGYKGGKWEYRMTGH